MIPINGFKYATDQLTHPVQERQFVLQGNISKRMWYADTRAVLTRKLGMSPEEATALLESVEVGENKAITTPRGNTWYVRLAGDLACKIVHSN